MADRPVACIGPQLNPTASGLAKHEMEPDTMKNTAMILAATASCLWMPIASVPAFAKDAAADKESATDDTKIRCRKIEVTGSLVRKTKVCRTVAEWREISEKGNRNVRDILESGQVCAGGPSCNGN